VQPVRIVHHLRDVRDQVLDPPEVVEPEKLLVLRMGRLPDLHAPGVPCSNRAKHR
jgi:hypothetical protein